MHMLRTISALVNMLFISACWRPRYHIDVLLKFAVNMAGGWHAASVSLHNACLDKDKGQTPNIQYSSDYHIGIITDTTSNISSTCIVLALALTVIIVTAASLSATLFSLIVTIASEMHFNALHSLTQPCLTAYCIRCNTPMIQALYQALQISVSLGKCIWDPMYQG